MGATREGGIKAAITNKAKYGPDFYKKIGAKGGANGNTGGFYGDPEAARKSGLLGGRPKRITTKQDL